MYIFSDYNLLLDMYLSYMLSKPFRNRQRRKELTKHFKFTHQNHNEGNIFLKIGCSFFFLMMLLVPSTTAIYGKLDVKTISLKWYALPSHIKTIRASPTHFKCRKDFELRYLFRWILESCIKLWCQKYTYDFSIPEILVVRLSYNSKAFETCNWNSFTKK